METEFKIQTLNYYSIISIGFKMFGNPKNLKKSAAHQKLKYTLFKMNTLSRIRL